MKNVARLLPALLFFAVSSCNEEEKQFSETAIHAKADSIVGARAMELNQQAMDDLEKRMAIEVKAKADSIIAARNPNNPKRAAATPATETPTDTMAMPGRGIFKARRKADYDTAQR
jgi:hypothetical protein